MPPRPRPWFRLYTSILTSRKVQRLKPPLFKHWVNFMALAGENNPRGCLPPVADVAFRLNISEEQAANALEELVALQLVDQDGDVFVMHQWDDWQKDRDVPPTKREGKSRVNHAIDAERHAIDADTTPLITDQSRVLYIDKDIEEDKEKERDTEVDEEAPKRRNIFVLYDNFMGKPAVTAQMRELLIEAEGTYPADCIEHCFQEAAASSDGRRSWRFVESILIRHQTEGCNGRPRQLQAVGRAHGRRQNSGDDIAAAWEDYDRRQREG